MKEFLRRRAVLLAVLAALGAALWFTPALWLRLDGWVQNQRDRVWEQLESVLGQKISYDRIAPAVLSVLDFQNVRLVADDGKTLFQAASVRLSWDWDYLFQGRFGEALRRIQVINASVSLDSRRDQALLDRWAGFFQSSPAGGGPSVNFQIEGFNLTARWTDGRQALALDRGFAVLSPQGGEWSLKFRGALAWEDSRPEPLFARLAVRGEMRADASFEHLNIRTEASSVRTSWFDLEPVSLQVSVDPEQLTVAKVSDRTPFDLQAVWDRTADRWLFKGAAEEFRPSQLVRIKGQKAWAGVADGTLTGKFTYRPEGDFLFDGRASWPAGSLPAPLDQEAVSVRGRVSAQQNIFQFQQFRLQTPRVALDYDGTVAGPHFLPEGTLILERWQVPEVGEAKGTLHLLRTGALVNFTGENWTWNTLGTTAPSGWVEKVGQNWSFSIQGPLDGTEAASFSAAGMFHPQEPRIEAAVELIALPLSVLREEVRTWVRGFDLPSELWALETTVRGQVEWGSSGPAVSVTSFAFHDPLVPDRSGTGTASWRGRHLDLALNPASWDAVRVAGALAADVEDTGAISGRLNGWLWNHPFDLSGRWVPSDKTLVFSGKPGIAGVVHQNDAGAWSAQLVLEPQEVAPGWMAGFEGGATLDGMNWVVDAQKITLGGRYPWNQEPFSARARLRADPGFFRLDEVVVADSHGSWTGSAVSSWSFNFAEPWAGRLALATSDAGRESLTVDWVGAAFDQWHTSIRAGGIDVTRAGSSLPQGLTGRMSVTGTADWTGERLAWSLQTALSEARYGDSPLGFRAAVSGTNGTLSVRNLFLSLNPLRISDGSADFNGTQRTWRAGMAVGLRLGAGDWESRWTLAGGWSPEGAPTRISGSLDAKANTWSQRSFQDWSLTASWGPESWQADLAGVSARGEGETFQVSAEAPFPVRGEAQGRWSGGQFELGVRGFHADLSLIKDFINTKFFSISNGTAGGDFTVGGSFADPEVNGVLTVRGVSLASSFLRQGVGPLEFPLVFEGHRVRIDPVDIGPGDQTWMVSGAARLDHLLPEEYQLSIQTDALSVIPVSYQYTGISASGGVTGLVVIRGTPIAVTLGGRLIVQDAVITLKPTADEEGAGEPIGFNADLTLVTGRKVEFLWPNETLPLLRAVTASGQTVVVKANDIASTWSVTGKLGLRTGEINYLNRTFVLKEGQLGFQEDQTSFDPRISVRAEWKLREASGPVIISLRADGTLARFSPRFDSVPYKSPDELQQLVGTTLALPTDYTRETNIETALSVASDVGTSFLLTPFEETVKKNFQLDLFTVKTEILKKSLLNRNGPLEASDYLDNTRLFFGKYIGDDLFLQGTLAFRRDGSVATQESPKMVVEPEFQMEFQTPFFLLNWTLLPQHPETLFVTDNTVTFRWNWSY